MSFGRTVDNLPSQVFPSKKLWVPGRDARSFLYRNMKKTATIKITGDVNDLKKVIDTFNLKFNPGGGKSGEFEYTFRRPEQPEEFDFDKYLVKMDKDKRVHIRRIAAYLYMKGLRFDTKEKVGVAIKRHSRAAKMLDPFTDDEVINAMQICRARYKDFPWTLETVYKVLTS